MITKKSIAEQVQRIVNGGSSSDDSKVTLQEVIALVEQERDAMVKKHILENSVLGDHEIPSAFLTKRKVDVLPQISFPSHARAAIKSMEARYKNYILKNDEVSANKYLLNVFSKCVYV